MTSPPRWRYTWESLAHIPILRLFLFTHQIKPLLQCKNLKISLEFGKSQLVVSWNEEGIDHFSLRVPVPRVLIDLTSPVDFKAMEDHIEVKLVLLLPVDDPLFRNFTSGLNISSQEERNLSQSLSVHSDLKYLSSQSEVHFFCTKCSAKLTKNPLRSFIEMPSADWREVADNWFGSCCCSFGGISEKLVKQYANSYLFSKSTCLLDASSVVVSIRDLAEHVVPDVFNHIKESDVTCDPVGENVPLALASGCNGRQTLPSENQHVSTNDKSVNVSQIFENTSATAENLSCISLQKEQLRSYRENERGNTVDSSLIISPTPSDLSGSMPPEDEISSNNGNHCCADESNIVSNHDIVGCSHDSSGAKDQEVTNSAEPLRNQNALLNISLGNGFMVRNPNLTKDVDWVELRCPLCSSTLGAYPSNRDVHAPADAGIRLFKCYTSTGLPVGGSDDIFRNYTLHRLFINQLMEIAHDELSFRTVVRDITTRSPTLQIVLLNSDAWRCTGYCLETENIVTNLEKVDMLPIVKVLFSDCSNATEAQSRVIEEWATKNEADEVFMLRNQVMTLIESLNSEMKSLPPSCSTMEGLSLSSIER